MTETFTLAGTYRVAAAGPVMPWDSYGDLILGSDNPELDGVHVFCTVEHASRALGIIVNEDTAMVTLDALGNVTSVQAEANLPLASIDEHLIETGAHWTAEAPGGECWVIRWTEVTGTVQARPWAHSSPGGFSGEAGSLRAARVKVLRIAGLIADGKTEED